MYSGYGGGFGSRRYGTGTGAGTGGRRGYTATSSVGGVRGAAGGARRHVGRTSPAYTDARRSYASAHTHIRHTDTRTTSPSVPARSGDAYTSGYGDSVHARRARREAEAHDVSYASPSVPRHRLSSGRPSQWRQRDSADRVVSPPVRTVAPDRSPVIPAFPEDVAAVDADVRRHRRRRTTAVRGIVGLHNLGNTCFMNSGLQCLFMCPPLRDYFLGGSWAREINKRAYKTKGRLARVFAGLMESVWSGEESTVAPRSFKQILGRVAPQFTGFQQQDSQEFLRFLLDGLSEDLSRVKGEKPYRELDMDTDASDASKAQGAWEYHCSREDSVIVDCFGGQLASSVECLVCGHISKAFDPYLDLSLPIPKAKRKAVATGGRPGAYSSSRGYDRSYGVGGYLGYGSYGRSSSLYAREPAKAYTLADCLSAFVAEETLTGDEQAYCSKCKTHQDARKSLALYRLPQVLMLHLKRFGSGGYRKLSNVISFPTEQGALDLADYCSSDTSVNPVTTYSLFAVSNHSGGMGGGHYTAVGRHPDTGRWYSFDDSHTSSVDASAIGGSSPYVLFFVRTDVEDGRSSSL